MIRGVLFSSGFRWFLGVLLRGCLSTEQHLPLAVGLTSIREKPDHVSDDTTPYPSAGAHNLPWGPHPRRRGGEGRSLDPCKSKRGQQIRRSAARSGLASRTGSERRSMLQPREAAQGRATARSPPTREKVPDGALPLSPPLARKLLTLKTF